MEHRPAFSLSEQRLISFAGGEAPRQREVNPFPEKDGEKRDNADEGNVEQKVVRILETLKDNASVQDSLRSIIEQGEADLAKSLTRFRTGMEKVVICWNETDQGRRGLDMGVLLSATEDPNERTMLQFVRDINSLEKVVQLCSAAGVRLERQRDENEGGGADRQVQRQQKRAEKRRQRGQSDAVVPGTGQEDVAVDKRAQRQQKRAERQRREELPVERTAQKEEEFEQFAKDVTRDTEKRQMAADASRFEVQRSTERKEQMPEQVVSELEAAFKGMRFDQRFKTYIVGDASKGVELYRNSPEIREAIGYAGNLLQTAYEGGKPQVRQKLIQTFNGRVIEINSGYGGEHPQLFVTWNNGRGQFEIQNDTAEFNAMKMGKLMEWYHLDPQNPTLNRGEQVPVIKGMLKDPERNCALFLRQSLTMAAHHVDAMGGLRAQLPDSNEYAMKPLNTFALLLEEGIAQAKDPVVLAKLQKMQTMLRETVKGYCIRREAMPGERARGQEPIITFKLEEVGGRYTVKVVREQSSWNS